MTTHATISLVADIPEILHQQLNDYATDHGKDRDDLITAAIALFLLQNTGSTEASRIYLDCLFTTDKSDSIPF